MNNLDWNKTYEFRQMSEFFDQPSPKMGLPEHDIKPGHLKEIFVYGIMFIFVVFSCILIAKLYEADKVRSHRIIKENVICDTVNSDSLKEEK